jgi:DNA-directed RNA polymerase specialized sigma24 family protein
VRLPKNARGEAPWTHQSLDQVHPESGSSWLDGLASPDNTSAETEEARDLGLEAMVDQLPTAQAAALRLTVLEGLSLRSAARQLGIEVDGFYWTDSAPDIVNSGREEQGLVSV